MNFEAASLLTHEIESEFPGLVVAGFRRLRQDVRADDWGLDVIDLSTGRMETIDEKDPRRERLGALAKSTEDVKREAA